MRDEENDYAPDDSSQDYSEREKHAMSKHRKRSHGSKSKGEGKKKGGHALGNPILRFIFMNPTFLLILLGLMAIFVIYLVSSADAYLTDLIEKYVSLSAKPTNSQNNFDKRLFFVVVNPDGTKTIVVGAKSEEALADLNKAVEEAGGGDGDKDKSVELTGDSITFSWPVNLWYLKDDGSLAEASASKYYAMGRENDANWYKNLNWSAGTKQRQLHDSIQNDIDSSKMYATYNGFPLTAMSPYFSANDVGTVVRVTFDSGDEVDMLIIDSKSSGDPYSTWPNASAFSDENKSTNVGHYYVEQEKLAITEFICERGSTITDFNNQFGTNITSNTKITKITKTNVSYP